MIFLEEIRCEIGIVKLEDQWERTMGNIITRFYDSLFLTVIPFFPFCLIQLLVSTFQPHIVIITVTVPVGWSNFDVEIEGDAGKYKFIAWNIDTLVAILLSLVYH